MSKWKKLNEQLIETGGEMPLAQGLPQGGSRWGQLNKEAIIGAQEQFVQPSREPGFIGAVTPDLPEQPPYTLQQTEPYVRPSLELGGTLAGGTLGAVGGVPGAVGGGALGYATGKKFADIMYKKPKSVKEEMISTVNDVGTGAAFEMAGHSPVVARLISAYGKRGGKAAFNIIKKNIQKAIRPTVAQQRTGAQYKAYLEKATDAVSSIVINQKKLNLIDDAGKKVDIPQSLRQFQEAIDQTKTIIFKKYDKLAKEAGAAGVKVDLKSIANDLSSLASDPTLQDFSPDVIRYAADKVAALNTRGRYTPSQAQEAIAILNKKLTAFYKNPSYEGAQISYVDAMISNKLRSQLDGVVSLLPKEYQSLKNTYGALKTIEGDVARRAAVDARKNIKGLIDFADIFSGSQALQGIILQRPDVVASGVGAKMISSFYRYLNNPNRIIKTMFADVAKVQRRKDLVSSIKAARRVGVIGAYTLYQMNDKFFGEKNK
ncbi:MAG: hypothetical protein ACYSTX_00080 [Planctomycetota bacterium]|jgi:hypothetical protein